MSRIFIMASHICAGESGGGHGVVYRLYMADMKYGLFDREVIYVFGDRVIKGHEETGKILEQKDQPKQRPWSIKIKKYIPAFLRIGKMNRRIRDLQEYLDSLDKEFGFEEDDIFLFHDFRIAYAFTQKYNYKRCSMIHHMQGSIYYEWHAETGIESKKMQQYYNRLFQSILEKIRYLCFPSMGTEESLVHSEPAIRSAVKAKERKYLYNGVSCPEIESSELPVWVKELEKFEGYKFITVANLNEAKAVERIPEYMGAIKKAGISFRWILVGNGVKASEVEENIERYGLKNEVIWVKNSVQHTELMQLFSIADFYILFHKYSIFDLSTLEAMHYGAIPILTPVGGNKEVIIQNNGIFVTDFSDISLFRELIKSKNLKELKALNHKIQMEKFDDRAFLERYVALCDGMNE